MRLAGRQLATGDVNGDGIDDLVVPVSPAGRYAGGANVVARGVTGSHELPDVGVGLTGSDTSAAGRAGGTGDANADGLAGVITGAPYDGSSRAYVLMGPVSAGALVDVPVQLIGTDGEYCGHGADLADVNGDGLADALVSACRDRSEAGMAYVVDAPLSGEIDLEGDADALLVGPTPGEWTGRIVRGGGDVNGDGTGDIVVPTMFSSAGGPQSGAVHLVLGPVTGERDLDEAQATLVGAASGDWAGEDVAMGDVDGDGFGDVLVGSLSDSAGESAGACHVMLGPVTGTVDLGAVDVVLLGGGAGASFGFGIGAGDLDGDGLDEVLVGAPGEDRAHLFAGEAELAWFLGESAGSHTGYGVALGDLDGDGWGDVAVGAPLDATNGESGGAVFVQLSR